MQSTQISQGTTIDDMRATQLEMQSAYADQSDAIADIQTELTAHGTRLQSLEDQMVDWRFYEEHGYWPGVPPP